MRRRIFAWGAAVSLLTGLAVVLGVTGHMARSTALESLRLRSQNDLRLYIANLRRELEKYEYLPELLADDQRLRRLLQSPADVDNAHEVNRYLELAATISQASDVYLMDRNGRTLAASNWRDENTFIGDDYSFRPYFKQAMAGDLGRYFALGWASRQRGFYFAFPVRVDERVLGAVAVKVSLAALEAERGGGDTELVVTDPDGVVFLSTRRDWIYRSLRELTPEARERIESTQRYRGHDLTPLPIDRRERLSGGAAVLAIGGAQPARYLRHSADMAEAGWRVHVFADTAGVYAQTVRSVLLAGFVFGALVLAGTIVVQRRARLAERMRYERAAMETAAANEARVRAIIDNTQAGLVTLDAAGNIRSLNPTAEAMLGRTAADVAGEPFTRLLARADAERFREQLAHAGDADDPAPAAELTGQRGDGSTFPLDLALNRMSLPEGTRFIATLHDVTERKENEMALRRAHDELEQRVAERTADLLDSNRRLTREIEEHRRTESELKETRSELIQAAKLAAIGQLSAGINHELNQPLTAIRTYSGNAHTLLEKQRYEDVEQNLQQIDELTERMRRIITQLKLFARKSAGKPVPVAVPAVLDGALQLLSPRLSSGKVAIDRDLPDGDVLCLGDMVLLEQVFVNLIGNALQAVEATADARVSIHARTAGAWVCVTVRDNGPGIAEEDLPQIFDAFYTTKSVGHGLGLGLSISSTIIDELGGTMRAHNHPEGGAVFTVELPAAHAPRTGSSRIAKGDGDD